MEMSTKRATISRLCIAMQDTVVTLDWLPHGKTGGRGAMAKENNGLSVS